VFFEGVAVAERPRTLDLVLQAYPVKLRQTQRKFRHESLAAPMNPTLVIANKNLFVLVVPAVDFDAPFRNRVR
jgi:hypothetical protein